MNKHLFKEFDEGQIMFAPTYKRKAGLKHNQELSVKRNPSWTDRILFKAGQELTLDCYDSNNLVCLSDHRPVFAQFTLKYKLEEETPPGQYEYGKV